MKFKDYLKEKDILDEQTVDSEVSPSSEIEAEKDKKQATSDNEPQVTIQEMVDYMTNENWSRNEKKLNEACKYMKEMYKDDKEGGKDYIKGMDNYTTGLNEKNRK